MFGTTEIVNSCRVMDKHCDKTSDLKTCNRIRKLIKIVDRYCNKLECYVISMSNLELKHPSSASKASLQPCQTWIKPDTLCS